MPRQGKRRGGLSAEDRALWSAVARGVTPISPAIRGKIVADPPPPIPHDHALVPVASSQPLAIPPGLRVGSAAPGSGTLTAPPSTPAERLSGQPLRMDARAHRDLTRGKLRPEARIDLHGMTLGVAKAELTGFILSAQASGRRLVLVITGKGKGDLGPLPTRSGALRHEVPHWLHMAPMAGAVMQVVPAHIRHGGAGAYYVYLRRFGR